MNIVVAPNTKRCISPYARFSPLSPRASREWLGQVVQFAICFGIFIALTFTATADERMVEFSGATMGTTYHIKVVDVRQTATIQTLVEEGLNNINALMSTYLPDSEVSQFNRSSAGGWFPVSPETLQVVALAQSISHQTDGAFDITVGPLVRLWSFGAHAPSGEFTPPSESEIKRALEVVGWSKLETRQDPPALRKSAPELEMDLSAIAKGFAVDKTAELLLGRGVSSFMIEIGGEVRVAGSRPDGGPWRIGIEAPDTAARRVATTLQLREQALASSGGYRNFHEHNGTRYSHTIDPRTGRPVDHDLTAVSVLATDCATADALATTLLVLGPEAGRAWAEEHQVAALLTSRVHGELKQVRTSYVDANVVASPQANAVSDFAGTFLTSVIVFAVALLAMSVGVLIGRRRIRGSCGGLAGLTDQHGNTLCDACTNPAPACQGDFGAGDNV